MHVKSYKQLPFTKVIGKKTEKNIGKCLKKYAVKNFLIILKNMFQMSSGATGDLTTNTNVIYKEFVMYSFWECFLKRGQCFFSEAESYDAADQVRFKNKMISLTLCDYKNTYIHVKGKRGKKGKKIRQENKRNKRNERYEIKKWASNIKKLWTIY